MTSFRLTFFLSEHRVEIRTDVAEVHRALESVWQSCEQPVVPPRDEHVFDTAVVDGMLRVRLDGTVIDDVPDERDLLPILDRALYWKLREFQPSGRAFLHAATLVGAEGGLVIAGKSGAGKSSLSWAGICAGYLYAGDEICVSDGQRVWGVPRAVLYDPTRDGSVLPSWIEGAECGRYRLRHKAGGMAFLPMRRPPRDRVASSPLPVSQVNVVMAEHGDSTSLEPCPPLVALERIYAERSGDILVPLNELVHAKRCWRLRWREPNEAFQLLSERVMRPATEPLSR